jgi:hypothetical protein
VPMAVGVWLVTFIPVRALVGGYQHRRHQRRIELRERRRPPGPETATDQEPRR